MKLAAIYNVWDGIELLPYSIASIRDHVDVVIIVWQEKSNWGEVNPEIREWLNHNNSYDIHIQMEPGLGLGSTQFAMKHETAKRQAGINKAIELGCTHFIGMDSDELYRPDEFELGKFEAEQNPDLSYAVPIWVYYKSPTLCLDGIDTTYVPFICPLPATTGMRKTNLLIDPTRRTSDNYELLPNVAMHHFSWVRKNGIESKTRNSTARKNIHERPKLLEEWNNADEGTVLREIYPGYTLMKVANEFNIPEWSEGTT